MGFFDESGFVLSVRNALGEPLGTLKNNDTARWTQAERPQRGPLLP
jgi:hypothetical protein